MAIVKPFKALRPAVQYAKDVAALPYDVYDREEAKAYVKDVHTPARTRPAAQAGIALTVRSGIARSGVGCPSPPSIPPNLYLMTKQSPLRQSIHTAKTIVPILMELFRVFVSLYVRADIVTCGIVNVVSPQRIAKLKTVPKAFEKSPGENQEGYVSRTLFTVSE